MVLDGLIKSAKKDDESFKTAKIDFSVKNNFGRVAFEEALQAGHGDIAEMLGPHTNFEDDKLYYAGEVSDDNEECEGLWDEESKEQKGQQDDVRS